MSHGALAAILRDAAQGRGPQDDGDVWGAYPGLTIKPDLWHIKQHTRDG
jgi:hypothetical protein